MDDDQKRFDLVLHITVDWQKHRNPQNDRTGGIYIQQTRECAITGRILERSKPFWYEVNHKLYWIRTFQLVHMTAILFAFRHAREWNPTTSWSIQKEADNDYNKLQAIQSKHGTGAPATRQPCR